MSRTPEHVNAAEAGAFESDVERFLRELVEIRSESGRERDAAERAVREMSRLGLDAWIDEAGNAIGHVTHPGPHGEHSDIMLLGHLDTFPGVLPVRREGDNLFGRGAVDAKGAFAAFVIAASRAVLPPGIRLVVAGATEEESASSRGARHLATRYRPAACIIGEPSGWDGVAIGYKGRVLVDYRRSRPLSHSAGPAPGVADELVQWWNRVTDATRHLAESQRAFDRVQATLREVGSVSDGIHECVHATASFRVPPGVTPELIAAIARREALPDAVLGVRGAEQAFVAPRDNAVVRSLFHAIRARGGSPKPKVKSGTCDLNVVAPVWQCPIAAYGPGDSSLDHTPEERLSMTEFAASIDVLTIAVERLASETADSLAAPRSCPRLPV